jgi:DNA-binding transcriptional regulator YdaS (Cro superfamily)
MNLREFMISMSTDARETFAKDCGTSVGYLSLVWTGARKASADFAMQIERATKGAVTCEELRPDIDWRRWRDVQAREKEAA